MVRSFFDFIRLEDVNLITLLTRVTKSIRNGIDLRSL